MNNIQINGVLPSNCSLHKKKNSIKINKLLKKIRTKNQILEHFMFVEWKCNKNWNLCSIKLNWLSS
jgi:hypothetical protein